MKRAMLWGVALCILLLCFAALAAEKPAGGASQSQTSQVQRPSEQRQNLSPEERAKLREKWKTMSDEERAQARAKLREKLSGDRSGLEAGSPQSVASQIAALKQEQQATMNELKAIRQLAAKEKATETGKALDGLIARHEQNYQRRLQQLEQRQQRVEAAQKGASGGASKTDSNSRSTTTQKGSTNPGQKEPANSGTPRRK